jgi:hypothetical protein
MNIFALDVDPKQAAKWHCDAHVVKMTLETAQMLSSINRLAGKTKNIYKMTHINHPCVIWGRKTTANYRWLWKLGFFLSAEYTARFGKVHASTKVILNTKSVPRIIPICKLTRFALCMPDEYKQPDRVQAYRDFYKGEKSHGKMGSWKRNKPHWW